MTESQDYEEKKKPWGWIVAIVLVAIVAFSAGYFPFHSTKTTTSSVVNIEFYESVAASEAKFINDTLIPQFESEYPGIHVTFVNVGSEDVSKDILALEASGHVGPIVAGQDNLEIGQLIYSSHGNVLMNLTAMAPALMPSSLIPAASNLVEYEQKVFGGIYFFPFRGNVPLVFYNKTEFAKAGISAPPANYTQLLNDAKAIKSATGQNAIMIQGASTNGGHTGSSTATEMYQMMVQFGGNPLYLNDTGDIHAVQMLYNLSAYFSKDFTTGYWGSYRGLAVGNYSILDYQWPYVYNILTASPYNMNNTTLGVYPGPAGPVNGNHVLGGDVLFIPKGATNIPSLEAFIRFLLGAQAQRETLLNLSWVAINQNAYRNLPKSESVIFTALEQAIATGVFLRNPTPWITEWQTIFCQDVFNPVFVTHIKGYSDIPSLLSYAHSQMYDYIEANYGSANATLYNNPDAYAPISV
ncbi:carbohydrate ABC transporter substrate-binding protein [Thermoplasma sp. Kam2015]|uniref:ABC transporter substrate-binding protein n=1 Tax=Thermoplasma sp. Kam2015 TaxID=2094122 RepID=UPI000D8231DD|nr:ABC transporter substrate-binding protein [Thermoplasma sp. Kam2015]PYB69039.1 carbohydrate ABC transporter substrate-binding protein [Thermoplasma sp. Kam2015]